MRISVATVCAFAAILARDINQRAIATPLMVSGEAIEKDTVQQLPVLDVDILAPDTASTENIAPPENIALPENVPKFTSSPNPSLRQLLIVPVEPVEPVEPAGAIDIPVPYPVPIEVKEPQPGAPLPLPPLPSPPEIAPPEIAPPEIAPPETVPAPAANSSILDHFAPAPNLFRPTQLNEVQTQQVVPITLEQAIELARRNNLELQIAELELERTRAALQETQAANSPTVDATANLTTQQANNSTDNNPSADLLLGGSLEVNYDIYTSGRRSALIQAAEGRLQAQALQVKTVSETLELDVTNAYYDLQQADEQVKIAQAASAQAELSLRNAIAVEQAGIGTRFDRLQTEVDLANARQELVIALSQQQGVRSQIKRRLNIAESIGLSAADPVKMAGTWNSSLEETILLAYQNRAELEQQLVQRTISQQQRRAALAESKPQISVFASYNLQNSLIQGNGLNDDYQLGARVRLRLLDGGAAKARAAQETANGAIAEARFADTRNQIRLEVEEAYLALQSNLDNTQTASQAVDAAAAALSLARLRFQAGVDTQTDVSRLQTELTRAEGNRLQTILGYNRALAALQRAISQMPFTQQQIVN